MDNYIIDVEKAQGWQKFQAYCYDLYGKSTVASMYQVYDWALAQDFGYEYPRVRVKAPRTYPAYLRFRTEAEYTAFALRWA